MPDKPPEPDAIERWTAQRKAAIILEVLKGQILVPEAGRKYGFTQNEYRKWADEYHQAGVEALPANRKDQEAKHQAEIKRLRAKIGQLVMDDEIRHEAMRPFFRAIRRRSCGRQRQRTASKSLSTTERGAKHVVLSESLTRSIDHPTQRSEKKT